MADDMENAPLTFRAFIGTFADFLTVAIHTILYERKIYPPTSFLTTKKYEFAVRQNRHPKVCEWINDAVAAVENELLKGVAERIAIVIYSKENIPQERFVFDVSHFLTVAFADVDASLESILPLVDLEEQLRGAMNRLANCSSALPSLPGGCTFTVAVELKPDVKAPLEHPQPWAPTLPRGLREGLTSVDSIKKTQSKPISTIAAGDMLFDMWVEKVITAPAVQTKVTTDI